MEKEASCINARAILDYVKEHNDGDIQGLLESLHPEIDNQPDPESFFRDPNNWVPCSVISRLFERARILFSDEMIGYKVARYTIENMTLGYAQRIIVMSLWSYKQILKNSQKLNDKWNRTKKVELVEINRNGAIIRLHWHAHMGSTKDICIWNQGVYVYMPLIWGGEPISLTEEACFFEGDNYCEYHMKWPARNRLHEIFSRFYTSKSVLRETIKEMEDDKQIIEQKYEEVNRLNVELNRKMNQLLALQDTGKAILSVLDLEKLLSVIMNILSNVCKIDRALIMLVNAEDGYLEYTYGVGFDEGVQSEVRDYRVPLTRVSNILVRVTNTGKPEYVPDVQSSQLRKENIMLANIKPSSVYVAPLITRSKVIGVIATDAVKDDGVPKETRETLELFSQQIAIAIENARLYSALQEQMAELKRSQTLLSRAEKFSFLGNLAAKLAHEIKNPMTAIATFIQLLPNKFDDQEFREDFYKIAMEETTRVNNLITELLDLVKPKKPFFEYNDIHEVIEKMILLVSPQSNKKRIHIDRRFDYSMGQVWMDSGKIKQVVLNLLSNAIEFTPHGGRIEVLTRAYNEKGKPSLIRIEVKDNGKGIPESMIENIFDPYFTTKDTSNSGTGLGLSISYQAIKEHGGTIEVNSKLGEGATFIISLPTKPPLPEQ